MFNRELVRFAMIATLVAAVCAVSMAQSAKSGGPREGLLERALKGNARIIDLTQHIDANVPTYGGELDSMRYEKLAAFDREGYAAGALRIPEHFGTHVDSPGHFIAGGLTVDRLDVKRLIASAAVIDIRTKIEGNPDYQLTVADVKEWERRGRVPDGSAVLLLTGWDKRYSDAARYRNSDSNGVMHFPGYSEEAVRFLVTNRKIVALGIDTLSIDYGPSKDFAAHKISHAAGLYHIENIANLEKLPARGAVIFVGPLPIDNGSGSPARVLAIAP